MPSSGSSASSVVAQDRADAGHAAQQGVALAPGRVGGDGRAPARRRASASSSSSQARCAAIALPHGGRRRCAGGAARRSASPTSWRRRASSGGQGLRRRRAAPRARAGGRPRRSGPAPAASSASVLASWPVARAKSRAWRGLTTATGSPAAARARPRRRARSRRVASSTTRAGRQRVERARRARRCPPRRWPRASWSPSGRTAHVQAALGHVDADVARRGASCARPPAWPNLAECGLRGPGNCSGSTRDRARRPPLSHGLAGPRSQRSAAPVRQSATTRRYKEMGCAVAPATRWWRGLARRALQRSPGEDRGAQAPVTAARLRRCCRWRTPRIVSWLTS